MKSGGNLNYADEYSVGVVQAGDEASGNFKKECDEANEQLTIKKYLETDGKIWKVATGKNGVKSVIESIDGVGTKVQMYTNVFNDLIHQYEKGMLPEQVLFNTAVELRERMLHDLIAMNVDDLRNGEMAVAVTNIIDINHLKGIRGKFFADSMARAMGNVIIELDIAMTAGETAILGEPKKVKALNSLCEEMEIQIEQLLTKTNAHAQGMVDFEEKLINAGVKGSGNLSGIIEELSEVLHPLEKIVDGIKEKRIKIMDELEFNIGGTGLGVSGEKEKFVALQPGQKVVMLQEIPTTTGIIGPRSNGITSIRNYMTSLAGEGRECMTFEEFLEKIKEKADKIPQALKNECHGLPMWDIATGRTTVFNPFVSREILGGMENFPLWMGFVRVKISSQIHVTGNPGRKIKEGIKRGQESYGIRLDLDEVKLPQIIEILQHTCDISDDKAISSRNMGVPYALVCEEADVAKLLRIATAHGYVVRVIGEITPEEGVQVQNVGVGKTTITM